MNTPPLDPSRIETRRPSPARVHIREFDRSAHFPRLGRAQLQLSEFVESPSDPRFPRRFALHLMNHFLDGLGCLHDECKVILSSVLCTPFAVVIGRSHHPTDFKPGTILLLQSDLEWSCRAQTP